MIIYITNQDEINYSYYNVTKITDIPNSPVLIFETENEEIKIPRQDIAVIKITF